MNDKVTLKAWDNNGEEIPLLTSKLNLSDPTDLKQYMLTGSIEQQRWRTQPDIILCTHVKDFETTITVQDMRNELKLSVDHIHSEDMTTKQYESTLSIIHQLMDKYVYGEFVAKQDLVQAQPDLSKKDENLAAMPHEPVISNQPTIKDIDYSHIFATKDQAEPIVSAEPEVVEPHPSVTALEEIKEPQDDPSELFPKFTLEQFKQLRTNQMAKENEIDIFDLSQIHETLCHENDVHSQLIEYGISRGGEWSIIREHIADSKHGNMVLLVNLPNIDGVVAIRCASLYDGHDVLVYDGCDLWLRDDVCEDYTVDRHDINRVFTIMNAEQNTLIRGLELLEPAFGGTWAIFNMPLENLEECEKLPKMGLHYYIEKYNVIVSGNCSALYSGEKTLWIDKPI
jgi:hypothetical protein